MNFEAERDVIVVKTLALSDTSPYILNGFFLPFLRSLPYLLQPALTGDFVSYASLLMQPS